MRPVIEPLIPAEAAGGQDSLFSFSGPAGRVRGAGTGRMLPRGAADTLEARLTDFAARMSGSGIIGGGLPFRRQDDDYLWQAAHIEAAPPRPDPAEAGANWRCLSLRAEPPAADYAASVDAALGRMGGADLAKVVLARTLALEADGPLPQTAIFSRLARDPSITAFRVTLPGEGAAPPRALIGATPELLVQKTGPMVLSHPLAGSARRLAEPVADREAGERLARSDKDQREHAMVVEYILDTLAPLCRALRCPEGTALTTTRSMWHLGTRIEGTLRDPAMPSLLLAGMLHPTPAVCGLPCASAARLIERLEPVSRGFYAGAVGWSEVGPGSTGDGAWFVAIRCAEICGARARLYAGAGIVPGSDPAAETAETGAKFAAMLEVLGLPRDAALTLMPEETA